MIEVLIRLRDGNAGRQAGDIVSMKEYPNKGWGRAEGLPDYAVIRIPVERVNFEQYHKRHESFIDASRIEWGHRSKYRIDLSSLKVNIRNALLEKGFYEISKLTDVTGAIALKDFINYGVKPEIG